MRMEQVGNQLVERIKEDPFWLWIAALVLTTLGMLCAVLDLRTATVISNSVLVAVSAVMAVSLYKSRQMLRFGFALFLMVYGLVLIFGPLWGFPFWLN